MKLILVITSSAAILAMAGVAYGIFSIKNLPDPALFDQRQIAQSTKIYDRTGTTLLYELHGEQKRTVIPFAEIPELIKRATIAVEDRQFYEHAAIDWQSLARALMTNIFNLRVVQGGSTITQQLAKNAFLKPERTVTRKIKEAILAYRLEKRYTKDEILNLYLNQIPYGANAYGIEAAAQTYFNKRAAELSLPEMAALVSLPKAPSYYSPWGAHLNELLTRKNIVLELMTTAGVINESQKEEAQKSAVAFAPQHTSITAPHFVMAVQDYLIAAYGEDFVRSAGLRVITTIDLKLQQLAEKVVADGAKRNEELYKGTNAALVAQDSATGQILALVGSRNYFDDNIDGKFNVATQGLRQPGSAIKPLVYLTAFAKGFTPDTVLFDLETEFDTTGDPERSYQPQNFDERFRGPVTMRQALAQSINVPSVQTLYLAGIDDVLKTAQAMGITTLNERNRYGLSLALGGGEVTLMDMAGAYSVLSQDGIKHRQSLILSIEDARGKRVEGYIDEQKRVVEAQYIRLVNDILSDNDARAPLFSASLNLTIFPDQEVALKTGTTNDYRDAWAIGYTPSLVVGIWAGNNDNAPMEKRGGSILAAMPIWSAFMREAVRARPLEIFPRPDPAISDKPIMNNQYVINNEIHSVLYYVDRRNPLGPSPDDPKNDPQFANWEQPVMQWAQNNPQALAAAVNTSSISDIVITAPRNGEFIISPFTITAEIKSQNNIQRIETYLNNQLTNQQSPPPTKQFSYSTSITVPLETQNKITIKSFDASGNTAVAEIIVFRRE